jgi:hypothetical protein
VGEGTEAVDDVLQRMQMHRQVAEMVVALDEPYRTVLLLRFYEGRAPIDIATALGIPAGTIHWRINEGLRRLRRQLDQACSRERWRALLLPLIRRGEPIAPGTGGAGWPVWIAAGPAVLAAGALGAALWFAGARGPLPDRASPAAALEPAKGMAPGPASTPTERIRAEEIDMMTIETKKKAALLFGLVLPALVAGADDRKVPLTRREAINACVEVREKIFECRESFAEDAVKKSPPAQRAEARRKRLEEIDAEGSGPIEPRQVKCGAMYDESPPEESVRGLVRLFKECAAEKDCNRRKDCIHQLMLAPAPKR